ACSDSSSDTAASATEAPPSHCHLALDVLGAPLPDVDPSSPPDVVAAAMKSYAGPLVESARDLAGADDPYVAALQQAADSGDPSGLFAPEAAEARTSLVTSLADECSWPSVAVKGIDFAF